MPFVKSKLAGDPPKGGHLAVMIDEAGGHLAMPVGARLVIVEDPLKYNGTMPVILVRVNFKEIVVRCNCRQPDCTRVGRFKATWKGVHPHREQSKSVARETE